jgi:hypothetical protein
MIRRLNGAVGEEEIDGGAEGEGEGTAGGVTTEPAYAPYGQMPLTRKRNPSFQQQRRKLIVNGLVGGHIDAVIDG